MRRQEADGLLFGGSLYSHQTLFPLKGEACTPRNKIEVSLFPSALCLKGEAPVNLKKHQAKRSGVPV